jgi:hydroxyacylglutathione hydrolase
MILHQYYLGCLSHASYMIGDETTGRAIVVDPRRDISEYLAYAETHGLTIEAVINTHVHADFVSGHLELAAATGAWIGYGEAAQTDYPIRGLADGQHLSLGEVDLEILSTPGHTWESISLLVREHPDVQPTAVLTGDSLFIGDVGRPDTVNPGEGSTADLAKAMYRTIHEQLLTLPDRVTVMPAHGAGSSCGKNLSTELTSTIGEQRRTNPSVQPMSVDAFVALITRGQPPAPSYFSVAAAMNKRVHPLLDEGRRIRALAPAEIRAALQTDVRFLDTRGADDFAAGHLRGSVNVGLDGRFAETVGMVTDVGEPIVVIAYPDEEQNAALRLARIGSDNTIGYLTVERGGVFPADICDLVQPGRRLGVSQLGNLLADDAVTLIDVRNCGERELGTIPGAIHLPLAELRARLDCVPTDKAVVVYCAAGWRSSVAASLIRATGHPRVSDLAGGYTAWALAQADAGTDPAARRCLAPAAAATTVSRPAPLSTGRPSNRTPPRPQGAQTNAEEWARFFEHFSHARVRRGVRLVSKLPSAPRCEACGNPFAGVGGWLMRRMGKSPSRKNPRWCELCFEAAPPGGVTLTVGVLFADVRNSTALGETLPPHELAERLNRYYSELTQVIVQHGIVDKLIGDAVMGLYFAPLMRNGRYVDAMVSDAHAILRAQACGSPKDTQLKVGIGLAVGPAYVGIVGDGEMRDFTAIGDVVNIASRLQGVAAGGEIVMPEAVARIAAVDGGEVVTLDLKGKAEPLTVRRIAVAS